MSMMSSILAHQHEFIAVDKSTVLSVNFIYRKIVRPKPRQPVLLFVHGLGSNKAIWTETAEAICSSYGYTCILVDLRGHGDSADAVVGTAKSSTHSVDAHSPFTGRVDNFNAMPGKNDGSYTLAQSADDLAAILRSFHTNSDKWIRQTAFDPEINGGSSSSSSLEVSLTNANNTKKNALESFIAIGHSYGGNLAVEIAVRHPSLLSYLVLVDGGYIDLQGTFPDFNSCLLVLRPPSFAGISAEELEHIIRSVWALEGKVTHKGEECNDEEVGSNPSTGPARRSSSSSNICEELLRCDRSSSSVSCSSAGCWSEIGIQAMLKNFRTIRFDPNTVTTATDRCASTTKSSHASSTISISYEKNSFSSCTKNRSISSTNSSSANNNNNRSIISSSSSSSSSSRHECDSTSNRDSNVSINSTGISGFTVSCVQPVLTFQRYIMLLEDLWNRRPVDQFSALYDHAITSQSTIEIPITNLTVFHGNNGILKSIVFLPSGTTSPFSADKEKDIQKSVAAVQGWDRGGSDKVRDREMARICKKEKKMDTDNVRNEIRDRDRDRDREKVTNSRPGHRDNDHCRGRDESTHICPSQRGGNRNSQREEVGRVGVGEGVGEGDNNNKVVTEVLRINVKSTEIGIGTKVELKVQVQAEHRKLLSKQPNYEDSDKNNNDDNHDDKNSNDNDSDKNDVDNDNSDDDNNHDNGDGDDDNYDDNHDGSVCNTQCGIQYMISIKPFLLAGHNIPLQMPLQLAHTIHNYLT